MPLSYFEGVWEILGVFGFLHGVELRECSPTGAGVRGSGEDVIGSLLCRGQMWEVKP